jgi:glutamate formiminotransferase/formiminotetrahydrofolate cyclodeaminase
MQVAYQSLSMLKAMAEIGNPNSVSDAGVGVMCISTAVRGAHLNVKINAQDLLEDAEVKKILAEAAQMEADTLAQEQAILAIVNGKIKA